VCVTGVLLILWRLTLTPFLYFSPGKYCSFLIMHTGLFPLKLIWYYESLRTLDRTPWNLINPVARPLLTGRTTQTQKKRGQSSMPRVGFESTILLFERTKRFHASDRAATVICTREINILNCRCSLRCFLVFRSDLLKTAVCTDCKFYFHRHAVFLASGAKEML
jgi:hypothetical protein